MKNAFHFTSETVCVLKIFNFSSRLFGQGEKKLDLKSMVNFKICDVTWLPNLCNTHITHITQYFKK